MKWIHRLEPLWWLLFGAGGVVGSIVLVPLFFGLAVAAPLGWIPAEAVSFHRMHGLAANPAGRVILAAVPSLVFWHAAHHLRHFALDLGLGHIQAPLAYALYGLAALGTLASVAAAAAL